jgi:hypothetical protein
MANKKKDIKDKLTPKKPRKPRKAPKKKETISGEDNFPENLIKMPRELVLEYRAVLAEWKVAFTEAKMVDQKLELEKSQPKYKELLSLMQVKKRTEEETRDRGVELQRVQELIAKSVGIEFEEFRKNYAVDLETGVVNNIDFD